MYHHLVKKERITSILSGERSDFFVVNVGSQSSRSISNHRKSEKKCENISMSVPYVMVIASLSVRSRDSRNTMIERNKMTYNTESIIREYITDVVHMSLATSRDNVPWISEVHFSYGDDLSIYFRSKPTRRHSEEIAENNRVAGNIVREHRVGEPVSGIYFE
jgi:Pyridoxamine 5'-phosphate oxidase